MSLNVTFTAHNRNRGTRLGSAIHSALDSRERRQGLMGRARLDQDSGLWINPCEAVHTFGMRFPLDLVFIDRHHRVVKLYPRVPANRIRACLRASSVLELPPGTIDLSATRPGDLLEIQRNS